MDAGGHVNHMAIWGLDMANFRSKIPSSFGAQDCIFAGHPSDVEGAIELLMACVEQDVSLKEALVAVEDYLRKQRASEDLISEQLESVSAKFSGWLS